MGNRNYTEALLTLSRLQRELLDEIVERRASEQKGDLFENLELTTVPVSNCNPRKAA